MKKVSKEDSTKIQAFNIHFQDEIEEHKIKQKQKEYTDYISIGENLESISKKVQSNTSLNSQDCENLGKAIDVWEDENEKYKKFSFITRKYHSNKKYVQKLKEMKDRVCKT